MNKLVVLIFAWTVVMTVMQSILHPVGIQIPVSYAVGAVSLAITIAVVRRFGFDLFSR